MTTYNDRMLITYWAKYLSRDLTIYTRKGVGWRLTHLTPSLIIRMMKIIDNGHIKRNGPKHIDPTTHPDIFTTRVCCCWAMLLLTTLHSLLDSYKTLGNKRQSASTEAIGNGVSRAVKYWLRQQCFSFTGSETAVNTTTVGNGFCIVRPKETLFL